VAIGSRLIIRGSLCSIARRNDVVQVAMTL